MFPISVPNFWLSVIVPDRRMWAQQAPSTQRCEIGRCVNVCINVNYDFYEFKECKEKEKCMWMYRPVTVCLHYLAVMCIYMIYKCLSWGSAQQQDLGKPS